jgi:cytochrome c oxidase cbb3-type subunit 1
VFAYAAWHSLAWLVFANAIGVLLALLLLTPSLNFALTPWTYGRWMPVHIDIQLYGWCSLPLVAFLFKSYAVDQLDHPAAAHWARPILWLWSLSLATGVILWLNGGYSGKLFLDWTGISRILFPLALLGLWALLAFAMLSHRRQLSRRSPLAIPARLIGLALLLAVPALLYIASSPNLYPPINPDTGGPTGASQLESTLVIIAILLLLPLGLTRRLPGKSAILKLAWFVFVAESLLCLGLGRADVSHHRPTQYISLASLLLWIPLIPAYFSAFPWHPNTHRWRIAFLCWWAILVPTGWALFLPGVLDHFKFTDGLVGHSLLAMAGFVTSLLIFVMVELLGEGGWIFNRTWSFHLWQASVLAYVLIMFWSGWIEGFHPAFTMVPGTLRNTLYALRLLLGIFMFIASIDWFFWAFILLRDLRPTSLQRPSTSVSEPLA